MDRRFETGELNINPAPELNPDTTEVKPPVSGLRYRPVATIYVKGPDGQFHIDWEKQRPDIELPQ